MSTPVNDPLASVAASASSRASKQMSTASRPPNPDPLTDTVVLGDPEVGSTETVAGTTLKSRELAVLPAGVFTLIGPVVAPHGTLVVIWRLLSTRNVARVPLYFTLVVRENPLPLTVTRVPSGLRPGEKPAILGATPAAPTATACRQSPHDHHRSRDHPQDPPHDAATTPADNEPSRRAPMKPPSHPQRRITPQPPQSPQTYLTQPRVRLTT